MQKGNVIVTRERMRSLLFGGLRIELHDIRRAPGSDDFVVSVHGLDVPSEGGPFKVRTIRTEQTELLPAADK